MGDAVPAGRGYARLRADPNRIGRARPPREPANRSRHPHRGRCQRARVRGPDRRRSGGSEATGGWSPPARRIAPPSGSHTSFTSTPTCHGTGRTSVPPGRHAARVALARDHGEGWRVPPAVKGAEVLLRELPGGAAALDRRAPGAAPARDLDATDPVDGRRRRDPDHLRPLHGGYDPDDEDTRRQDDRIPERTGLALPGVGREPRRPFSAPRAVADLLLDVV